MINFPGICIVTLVLPLLVHSFRWLPLPGNIRYSDSSQALNPQSHSISRSKLFSTVLSDQQFYATPILSDEDDDETEDSSQPVFDEAPSSISSIKEGLSFGASSLNGSDVRVGIIMARWNADVIQGLYKVRLHIKILEFVIHLCVTIIKNRESTNH